MNIHTPVHDHDQVNELARKYAVHLDEKLPTLKGDKIRHDFLLQQLRNWERRYNWFVGRIDDPDFDPGQVTVFDFAGIISEITVRLARYEGVR